VWRQGPVPAARIPAGQARFSALTLDLLLLPSGVMDVIGRAVGDGFVRRHCSGICWIGSVLDEAGFPPILVRRLLYVKPRMRRA
jgi:hypothetical protein